MQNAIIAALRKELIEQADEKTKASAQHFFKEKVIFYGVKSASVNVIARKYYRIINKLSKQEIFALCEDLLRSDYNEEAFIAFDWAFRLHKSYVHDDFILFERWLHRYINNWAKCDTFCNHTIGSFIDQYPEYISQLKKWTKSDNRWLRRASAVSLIIPARHGRFLKDIFEIADILLLDDDDLVQKGYGWMLKASSQAHQREVFEYVMKNKKTMPRTALRYAIEKMPKELKLRAMSKD